METLPDGTPIEDVVAELKEAKAEIARLRKLMLSINALCNAPHWTAERRWKIAELTRL